MKVWSLLKLPESAWETTFMQRYKSYCDECDIFMVWDKGAHFYELIFFWNENLILWENIKSQQTYCSLWLGFGVLTTRKEFFVGKLTLVWLKFLSMFKKNCSQLHNSPHSSTIHFNFILKSVSNLNKSVPEINQKLFPPTKKLFSLIYFHSNV